MAGVTSHSEEFQLSRAVLDALRDPVLLLDGQLCVVGVNTAYLSRYECERSRVEGESVLDLAPGTWGEGEISDALDRMIETDDATPIDLLIDRQDETLGSNPVRILLRRIAAADRGGGVCRAVMIIEDPAQHDSGGLREGRIATLLHKASGLAESSADWRQTLVGCLELVCEMADWPVGHVCLPDANDPDRLVATDDWHQFDVREHDFQELLAMLREGTAGMSFGRGEGLPGQIWASGEPAWFVDMQDSPISVRSAAAARAGVRGAVGFPVKIKGETLAVLEFFSERPMAPDRALLALLRSLGEQVGSMIERARTETALRHSEQEFGELFEQCPIGVVLLSASGVIQRANTRMLEKLGYAAHDFVGHALNDFLIEKPSAGAIEACCATGAAQIFETRFRARDGSTRHVLVSASPRSVDSHLAYVRCFVRDITERKHDESERARLAAIVQSSDDAILGLSPDGLVTSWNRGAERLYGHDAEDVTGGSISLIVPPEREEEMTQMLETVKRGERVEQFETVRIHRDGRRIHVSMTLSPIRAMAEGESETESSVIGVAMIERDISERKRVAAEIRRAVQDAERANRAKGEFLANVSHELRTPMNAIIGMTELALDEPIPERVRDYLETANDSADMLLRLLNDILDFSRIEAGRFEIDEAKFQLRETLEETVKTLAVRAHEKGLEVGLHILPDVPERLLGDSLRLRQVLTNLVGNAIKFTETGEVVVSVENHLPREDNATIHFQVRDTGIGIPEGDQERIFAPFAQVDATSTRNHGGAGLGLAISRELVAMMHGRMWIESEPGRGTTFHFLAQFGLAAAPDHLAAPSNVVRELKGLPVLIVDDNATNRQILGESLENWQMVPVLTDSAEAALQELSRAEQENRRFPLIFVDGLMPGTDGFTLIEQIRSDEKSLGATILMLSSSERRVFRDRCEQLDIANYLEKPVTQSELLDTIVTTLHGPPLEHEATEHASRIGGAEKPLSILLVEDTPANRKVVTAVLNKRGHSVTIAADGREAVDAYQHQGDFDIILMDVQMPNMDGYQATGIIRAMEESQRERTPIIAMTAHAMRGDRERCLAAGMDAYLSKPIDVRRMLRLVERIASRARRQSRERAAALAARDDPRTEAAAASAAAASMHQNGDRKRTPSSQTTNAMSEGDSMRNENASPEPLFDKQSALERLGGDEQLFRELTEYFQEDSETLLSTLVASAKLEDWPAVRIAAHSLKGLAANFSARPATEAARILEDAAAAADGPRAKPLIDPTIAEIERLRAALSANG